MKIKRYFAADMRQAMRQVRDEQGSDAVILSNRKVNGGVELVTAIDYDAGAIARLVNEEAQPQRTPAYRQVKEPEPSPLRQGAQVVWSQDPAITAMHDELKSLRGMVQNQLSSLAWREVERQYPQQAELLKRLTRLGLSREVARAVAARVKYTADGEHNYRLALTHLSQMIEVTHDDILTRGGVVALVGPTGVGKTTTVAKLAARYTLRHGPHRVALITTDSYRIGAQQQLRTFGQLLSTPVYTANDARELTQLLDSLRDKPLVLIDTAGMSQRDLRLNEQLQMLKEANRPIRNYVVLSATSQRAALDDVARAFHSIPLSGAVITKLDEASSSGEALSVVLQHRLRLAYVSNGQRVPEDLHPARSQDLVVQAATFAKQQQARQKSEAGSGGRSVKGARLRHG